MKAELARSAKQPTDVLNLCRTIAESSPVPTAEVDPTTRTITCVNLAFCLLTGNAKQTLIGMPLCEVVPDGPECADLIDQVLAMGEAAIHEGAVYGPQSLQWTYTLWPVLVEHGRVSALIMQVTEAVQNGRDAVLINQALLLGALRQHELIEAAELFNSQLRAEMLARKATERALVRSEKLAVAGRMAAALAHEMNNPLASVVGLLYLVRTMSDVPGQAVEYLDKADAELNRIAHVIRQTLGFYRESSSATTFQAKALLESVADLLRAKIQTSGAEIQLQCDEELPLTDTYGELRQVLSNLLLNSLEAVGEQGRVVVRASLSRLQKTDAACVRFTLSDNGVGVDSAAIDHIFEAFYTTKGAIGNGLGLWVCQQIVSTHSGSLRVRSATQGSRRGTTFTVKLPLHSVAGEPELLT